MPASALKCPNCGRENKKLYACPDCGHPVSRESANRCPNCGKELMSQQKKVEAVMGFIGFVIFIVLLWKFWHWNPFGG